MRQKEIKYFGDPQQGRMNADDSPFALSPNEWINAENVRTGTTDKGVTGVVESVGGNEAITFPFVEIGNQKWMTENLNVAHFRNGDPIPVIEDPAIWEAADYAACCFLDNDPRYQNRYGKLYNWYAVNDPRGLAPVGWRVPTIADFDNMITILSPDAGGKAKDTSNDGFNPPNTGATNSSGLTMRGGGFRDEIGDFGGFLDFGIFWTSEDQGNPTDAIDYFVDNNSADFYNESSDKRSGYSVRLVYDSGRYTTIGSTEDTENNRLVYFNYDNSEDRNDEILCLYTDTNTIYKVIDSDQVTGGLNFDKNSLIHSARITGDILSWVDGETNQPRKININSGMKANNSLFQTDAHVYDFPLNFSEITMIKPPPIFCPNIERKSDPSYLNNFISTKSFEFAFQYQYYDSEKTVVGSYSIATRLDIQDSASNYIQVDMDGNEQIPSTVRRVFLVARLTDGNSNGGNSAFVAKTWDREIINESIEIDEQNNGTQVLTFNFYNNISGQQIAPDDVLRPYDSVPIYSYAHEVARNRFFLGNNIDGYNTPKTTSLNVSLINNSTNDANIISCQLYKITLQSTNTVSSGKQWALKAYLIFDGMDYWVINQSGRYTYTTNGNAIPADPTLPSSSINASTQAKKVGFQLSTIVNKLLPRVGNTTGAGITVTPTPSPALSSDGTSYMDIKTIELVRPIVNISVSNLTTSGYPVFAQQSPYKFGVVFYDFAMRKCGVIGNVDNDELDEVYEYKNEGTEIATVKGISPNILESPLFDLGLVQPGDTLVVTLTGAIDGTYTVDNLVPGVTNRVRVTPVPVVTGVTYSNINIKVYRSIRLEITTPTGASNASGYVNNIRWQLSNFGAEDQIPDWAYYYSVVRTLNLRTRYFIQSYTNKAVYFTKKQDGTWDEQNPSSTVIPQGMGAIGLPIDNLLRNGLGYTYEPELGDICILYAIATTGVVSVNLPVLGTIGNYILVKSYDLGYYASSTQGLDGMPVYYEIYHPYTPTEQEPYYEVGEIYSITDPTTSNREFSVTSGNFRGDCARVTRYISAGANTSTFTAVGMCANDRYYQRWDNDGGKLNVITDYGRTINNNIVKWSDAVILNSQINGTSTFRVNREKDIPNDCGSITKLQLTSKIQNEGTVMLGLCARETVSLYLGEQQVIDSTGGTKFFAASDNVISTINILRGNFGCLNPESVSQYRGRVYYYDASSGRWLQYSENGIDPISSLKMNRFWNLWSKKYMSMSIEEIEEFGDRPFVFGVVDPFHDELLINTPTLSDDPPKGYMPDYEDMVYPFDILDFQGKNIVYKIGMMAPVQPHWQGAYMFTTDYFGTVQNKLFSFRDGIPYLHNQDNQNTFYGNYSPSKIMYTANSLPQLPKVYDNFAAESNLVPDFVYFYNDSPYLQTSDLIDISFVNLEGVWYANILRNKIVPTEEGFTTDGLLTFEVMRNKNMYVMTQFSPTSTPLEFRIAQISYSVSKGHIV